MENLKKVWLKVEPVFYWVLNLIFLIWTPTAGRRKEIGLLFVEKIKDIFTILDRLMPGFHGLNEVMIKFEILFINKVTVLPDFYWLKVILFVISTAELIYSLARDIAKNRNNRKEVMLWQN